MNQIYSLDQGKVVTRVFIQNSQGKVLVGLRPATGSGANQWSIIGGKPDIGESLIECAAREVKEEVGLDLMNLTFIEKIIDNSWQVYLYKAQAKGEIKLDPTEVVNAMYVCLEDLENLDLASNHKDLLIKFFKENQ